MPGCKLILLPQHFIGVLAGASISISNFHPFKFFLLLFCCGEISDSFLTTDILFLPPAPYFRFNWPERMCIPRKHQFILDLRTVFTVLLPDRWYFILLYNLLLYLPKMQWYQQYLLSYTGGGVSLPTYGLGLIIFDTTTSGPIVMFSGHWRRGKPINASLSSDIQLSVILLPTLFDTPGGLDIVRRCGVNTDSLLVRRMYSLQVSAITSLASNAAFPIYSAHPSLY